MNSDRQKILTDYISYLYTTRRTYDTIGKYIKYVTDFLESAEDVIRNRMPRLRNGLKKPADLGRVERLKGLHSRSIRRGCSQFLKKGSAVIFSRNTSFLKRRLRWRTGWLCLPAEYMKMIRYWNRVPAAVLSLKPFIELVLL